MKLKFAPDLVIQVGHVEPVSTFQPKRCWQHYVECVCLLFIFVARSCLWLLSKKMSVTSVWYAGDRYFASPSNSWSDGVPKDPKSPTRFLVYFPQCHHLSIGSTKSSTWLPLYKCQWLPLVHCPVIIWVSRCFTVYQMYVQWNCKALDSVSWYPWLFVELENLNIHDQILEERVSGHQEPSGGWALAVVSCRWHRPCSNSC